MAYVVLNDSIRFAVLCKMCAQTEHGMNDAQYTKHSVNGKDESRGRKNTGLLPCFTAAALESIGVVSVIYHCMKYKIQIRNLHDDHTMKMSGVSL